MTRAVPLRRVLVANRGEIAVRIVRAAHRLQLEAVAVHPADDAGSRHVACADDAVELPGAGTAAYLDVEAVVAAAVRTGCDALHPGYGFLSESPALARACAAAGLVFVGASPEVLTTLGDKVAAREAARQLGVPVLAATGPLVADADAVAFRDGLGPGAAVMVKALAGGGGRGIQPVPAGADLLDALRRCRSEARSSFGDDAVFVEELMTGARHVEVQLLGDGEDVASLGDRDCSAQRRRQKLVEIAPAPHLPVSLRARITDAALALGRSVGLRGVATVELLVDVAHDHFVFLEVNPRIQVEHTVTEEVSGVDLVAAQLRLAAGARLDDLGPLGPISGSAVQLRLNAEVLERDGSVQPQAGVLDVLDLPTGRGVRVDTAAAVGGTVSPRYDSLVAKIVVSDPRDDLATVVRAAREAAGQVRVAGVGTNLGVLRALLARPELVDGTLGTAFVDTHLDELLEAATTLGGAAVVATTGPEPEPGDVPPGGTALTSPMAGVVVALELSAGEAAAAGATAVVLEAMKMEHVVRLEAPARIEQFRVEMGEVVAAGAVLAVLGPVDGADDDDLPATSEVDLDAVRPELAELRERLAVTVDARRPSAVERRRRTGHRTARENLADLVDDGSFVEYGALTVAAQRRRRPLEELIERTPADGLIAGVATVGGARCVVMAYDYTVLAGTQGQYNHRKQARLLDLAARELLPVVVYAEGGGGRPGDTDNGWITGLDEQTFARYAALSGVVPVVAVVTGRCFAGNAALAGLSDVIIATRDASLGMGGPAMIEGGGLGVVAPDDVGPMSVQVPNGVVDVLVEDEAGATAAARHYLDLLTRRSVPGDAPDARLLRHAVPENRSRSYDVATVVDALVDLGTGLELRPEFGRCVRTWLARVDGRSVGVLASNPIHLGGAIDVDGADKAARFLQLCDAHGLPVVSLCDTPGFMVGPDSERQAAVRHFARVFAVGAKLRVPVVLVVLRKAYGLGAMAMAGGSLHAPLATLSWPTGELGPMGLEGAVRLGYRDELAAAGSPQERQAAFDDLVAQAYQHGKALNVASVYEIDAVIDPADTRATIGRLLDSAAVERGPRTGFVDTW